MILVSAMSVLLQFLAAYLSIRMIRITGRRRAWTLIAAAITLAALRRSYELIRLIFASTGNPPDTTGELFSFVTSICMVIGVAYIAPLFLSIKRSEESLRKSETKFRIVSDNTHDWEYWLGPEGSFNYISPSCKLISGYEAAEFIADPDLRFRIIHPDDREKYENHRSHVGEKRAPDEIEFRIVRPDGTIRWIGHVCQPVFDGQGNYMGIRGSNRDITERILAENKTKQAYAELDQIFNSAADGMRVLDTDFNHLKLNRTFLKMLNMNKDEALGRKCHEIFPCPRRNTANCSILRVMKGEKHFEEEIIVERSDGEKIFCILHVTPFYGPDGSVAGVIEDFKDITERKKLELQLIQSQKLEAVGRLAGGIAHDFNNLLTPIIGYSDLLLSELPENHFAKDKISVVRDTGCRAANLVRQLLAFSRKQVLEMKPVNLNEVVWGLSSIFERTLGEDIDLDMNIMKPVEDVLADAGQIEQILMNLAVNARDAMPEGGRLTIETSDIYLDETYKLMHSQLVKPGHYVMLSVADTGTGMSPEHQEKIFEPFFTTKKAGEGTGLGLSTTYGIIRQHGGYIWVYSEPDKGTIFKVYLPAIKEKAGKIKRHEQPVAVGGTETILVVDDEPLIRQFVIDVLRPLGYKVLEASCANNALKICGNMQNKIDILLTDIVMPGMNGQEFAEIFKEKKPESRVIFMSGYKDNLISDSDRSGSRGLFVQKPIIAEKLTVRIREALDA